MEPEYVISLFDSCWFEHQKSIKHTTNSVSDKNKDNKFQEHLILKQPSILPRSKSDHLSSMTSFITDCTSPTSVLVAPHLKTIHSEKEKEDMYMTYTRAHMQTKVLKNISGGRRKLSSMSKSLSDLEFEELKGFEDLGFVFSEEDKDSSLVEIIPALHRLGHKDDSKYKVTRPYLSEAWQVLEAEKRLETLVNWKIPSVKNEMHMKNSLKWWAHTVASTVR